MGGLSTLFGRGASTIEVSPAMTLDQLWHEAEQLGQVEVDHELFSSGNYRARISFKRKSGTRIWAEGKDSNVAFALAKAINEARELGAG